MARLAKYQAKHCAKVGHLVHSKESVLEGGENLAQGGRRFPARAIVNCWLSSKEGHRENLLSPMAKKAAVGIAKSHGRTYVAWVSSFAPPSYPDCPGFKSHKPPRRVPKRHLRMALVPLIAIAVLAAILVWYYRSDRKSPTSPPNLVMTTSASMSMPTFQWTAATDTGSGVKGYLVRLDNGDWSNIGDVTTYKCVPVCDGNHTLSVRAVDKAGNKGHPSDIEFTCDIPPVISQLSVSELAETRATIKWVTDEPSTSLAAYGSDASCGSTSANDSILVTTHSVEITNLKPGQIYYYRVTSNDARGNQATSGEQTFETPWVGPNGEHKTETLPLAGATHTITLQNNPEATNPTWSELVAFLTRDRTDWHTYDYDSFVCADFAEMLHNNAELAGIRAGYVGIGLDGDSFAHAANVFNTTDRGLVYVDDTRPIGSFPCSADTTVTVSIGQQYIPRLISACAGYSSTFLSMGTVTAVTLYW